MTKNSQFLFHFVSNCGIKLIVFFYYIIASDMLEKLTKLRYIFNLCNLKSVLSIPFSPCAF